MTRAAEQDRDPKDAVQHTVEAGAETVAAVAMIVAAAVRDIAHALGGFATEMFEIRDAARKARAEDDAARATRGRHRGPVELSR